MKVATIRPESADSEVSNKKDFSKSKRKLGFFSLTPNKLTLGRILLLPLPCALMFIENTSARILALSLGSLLGITDYFDGIIARKRRKVSVLGKILDPVADKIFITTFYLLFVYLHYFSFILVFFVILREVLIAHLRSFFTEELKVHNIARFKTFFQMLFAGLVFFFYTFFPEKTLKEAISFLLIMIGCFSWLSAFPYLIRVLRYIKKVEFVNLKNFFASFPGLLFPVILLLTFPFSGKAFVLNIILLNFWFLKRGFSRINPLWSSESSFVYLFFSNLILVELIVNGFVCYSLALTLVYFVLRDGKGMVKISVKVFFQNY